MKETLTKNLGGSANDIAETIEHLKNDEILDTFNIDNENVESPTLQRKGVRQRSLRVPEPSEASEEEFGSRRRNLKFRTLGSSDKPLGLFTFYKFHFVYNFVDLFTFLLIV